jgi:phenylpropionate dioxygenase-like ring-hydroxylating dioxygenase large terminal subunit
MDNANGEFTNTHPALPDYWHPVALSDELAAGPVAVRLAGRDWVLARLGGDGAVSAFPDTCPHRRARLSAGQVVDGTLQCRYHGWRYGADGTCTLIPALERAASIPARANLSRPAAVTDSPITDSPVAENTGVIWLAPRTPRVSRPQLPPAGLPDGEDVATVVMPVMRVPSNAAILVDNFLDEAHFPFVHAATIGGAGPEPIARADISRQGLAFTAVREHTFTNMNDPAVKDGTLPAVQRRRMTYGYQAPLHATLLLEFLDTGTWQFLTFTVQPEDNDSCRVYQTLTAPGLADDPIAVKAAVDYEMSIFAEDLDLQRHALSGLEFPLDPAAELHIPADRISVEFRRVLAEAMRPPGVLGPPRPPLVTSPGALVTAAPMGRSPQIPTNRNAER